MFSLHDANFEETPYLRLEQTISYVPELEPKRVVNGNNIINYLEAIGSFYSRLSLNDWKALTIIDYKIFRSFEQLHRNPYEPEGKNQHSLNAKWSDFPKLNCRESYLRVQEIYTNILMNSTKSTPVGPTINPMANIGLFNKQTMDDVKTKNGGLILTDEDLPNEMSHLCDSSQPVWMASLLGKSEKELEVRALRLWNRSPILQSEMQMYTCFSRVPFRGSSWMVLDTSPQNASARADMHNRLFPKAVPVSPNRVLRVVVPPGSPLLAVFLPVMSATRFVPSLSFVFPPTTSLSERDISMVQPVCGSNHRTKEPEFRTVRRVLLIVPPQLKPTPMSPPREQKQNSTVVVNTDAGVDSDDIFDLANRTSMGVNGWPPLPFVQHQPPINAFRDVPLQPNLPKVVEPNCSVEDWFFYFRHVTDLFSAETGLPPTACIPDEKSTSKAKFDRRILREAKDEFDIHGLESQFTPGYLGLWNPTDEQIIPARSRKEILWYKDPNGPIPKPLLDYVQKPCDRPFSILQLSLIGIDKNSGKTAGHLNALIIDHRRKLIERFEPHGQRVSVDFLDFAEQLLPPIMNRLYPGYRVEPPSAACPLIDVGPQALSAEGERRLMAVRTSAGYCVCWSMLYINLRLINPNWSPEQVRRQMNRISGRNLTPFLPPMAKFILGDVTVSHALQQSMVPMKTFKMMMAQYIQQYHAYVKSFVADKKMWESIMRMENKRKRDAEIRAAQFRREQEEFDRKAEERRKKDLEEFQMGEAQRKLEFEKRMKQIDDEYDAKIELDRKEDAERQQEREKRWKQIDDEQEQIHRDRQKELETRLKEIDDQYESSKKGGRPLKVSFKGIYY